MMPRAWWRKHLPVPWPNQAHFWPHTTGLMIHMICVHAEHLLCSACTHAATCKPGARRWSQCEVTLQPGAVVSTPCGETHNDFSHKLVAFRCHGIRWDPPALRSDCARLGSNSALWRPATAVYAKLGAQHGATDHAKTHNLHPCSPKSLSR